LAEGAASGRPVARNNAWAIPCAGALTATVSSPALANRDSPLLLRRGRVIALEPPWVIGRDAESGQEERE